MTDAISPPFDPATLRFNDQGLIPAIAQAHGSGEVLMMDWMNAAAVAETLASGHVTYWSPKTGKGFVTGALIGGLLGAAAGLSAVANGDANAWALFERNEISFDDFDRRFEADSAELGHAVPGPWGGRGRISGVCG